jgi:hypothetical protein
VPQTVEAANHLVDANAYGQLRLPIFAMPIHRPIEVASGHKVSDSLLCSLLHAAEPSTKARASSSVTPVWSSVTPPWAYAADPTLCFCERLPALEVDSRPGARTLCFCEPLPAARAAALGGGPSAVGPGRVALNHQTGTGTGTFGGAAGRVGAALVLVGFADGEALRENAEESVYDPGVEVMAALGGDFLGGIFD